MDEVQENSFTDCIGDFNSLLFESIRRRSVLLQQYYRSVFENVLFQFQTSFRSTDFGIFRISVVIPWIWIPHSYSVMRCVDVNLMRDIFVRCLLFVSDVILPLFSTSVS